MINSAKKIRVGLIGLGGMGMRWAQVVHTHPSSVLSAVASSNFEETRAFCKNLGCNEIYHDWHEVVQKDNIDVVLVATPHVFLADIAQAALSSGKHVFSEKPGGISSTEIQKGLDIAEKKKLRYRVNFNMRLHPAVAIAKQKIDAGTIGAIMFMRGVYANSAREHFEKEWRCKKEISGGGELIDQGSHLIDIAYWFLGPFVSVSAFLQTAFWNIEPLEDNAFVLLKNHEGKIASLHASYTNWKKTFRIEVYGTEGYLIIEGLGGQYGTERLIHGKRTFGKEVPAEEVWEFPFISGKPDLALSNSWHEFVQSIFAGYDIGLTAKDGVNTFKIIEAAYRSHKEHNVVIL